MNYTQETHDKVILHMKGLRCYSLESIYVNMFYIKTLLTYF